MPIKDQLPTYQRARERYTINAVVDVVDTNRELIMGRLVNVHQEGMMVMGADAVSVDHLYQLELRPSQAVNGRSAIPLGGDCLWVRFAVDTNQYWSGFQIIDLSDESLADIETLITLFGQSS